MDLQTISERKINSIYLDTNNYDFARDNINGVSLFQRKLDFVGTMMMKLKYL